MWRRRRIEVRLHGNFRGSIASQPRMSLGVLVLGTAMASASPSGPDPAMCREARAAVEGPAPTDAQLYDAAVCAEFEAEVGVARASLLRLIDAHPQSALAPEAAYRLADLELRLARYRAAAEALEWVTRRYVEHERTRDALSMLAILWKGLDEPERARQALRRTLALFGRKDPERVQDAAWTQLELARDDDERLTLARALIREFGARLSLDRRAVAEATIGRTLWDRSCADPGPDGDCITALPEATTACDEGRVPRARVGRRKARHAAPAQEHFAVVLKIAARRPAIPPEQRARQLAYNDAVGAAMVLSAQPEFETLMREESVPLPRDPESARVELLRRIEARQRTANALRTGYADIVASKSPAWNLVAAERRARIAAFTDHWIARSAPARVERDSPVCAVIEERREPFARLAADSYTYCLQRAIQLQVFVPAARRCERWLGRHRAHDFPATVELFGGPAPGPTRLHSVGVIVDADQAMEIGDQLVHREVDVAHER